MSYMVCITYCVTNSIRMSRDLVAQIGQASCRLPAQAQFALVRQRLFLRLSPSTRSRFTPNQHGISRELKTKWDPDNFFRQNVNILPRAGRRNGG